MERGPGGEAEGVRHRKTSANALKAKKMGTPARLLSLRTLESEVLVIIGSNNRLAWRREQEVVFVPIVVPPALQEPQVAIDRLELPPMFGADLLHLLLELYWPGEIKIK